MQSPATAQNRDNRMGQFAPYRKGAKDLGPNPPGSLAVYSRHTDIKKRVRYSLLSNHYLQGKT